MRIGLDIRCLNRAHLRGMGKYVCNLLTHAPENEVRWELFADRPDLPLHAPEIENARIHSFDPRGYRFHSWEQFHLPRQAAKLAVDVLHCTATSLPWWQPVATVVTIHDTVPWTGLGREEWSPWYLERVLPRAYRKCRAVITISENSRRDILKLWPMLEPKLHVIPHGIDNRYLKGRICTPCEVVRRLQITCPYLLYLGGVVARKRLDWAIKVVEALDPDVTLVICGVDEGRAEQCCNGIAPATRSRLRFAPFIDEEHMPCLYRQAAAVLYPTLYEGFGLPVLEAHAVGTPILFSNVGSLAELHGPAAVVLPTEDLAAWVAAADRIIRERGANPSPDEQARNWAQQYTWDTSARRHFEVYRQAARLAQSGELVHT